VIVISSDTDHFLIFGTFCSTKGNFGGAYYPGYFRVSDSVVDPNTFRFAAVTDLDELSRDKEADKPTWRSYMMLGTIKRSTDNTYHVDFEPEMRILETKHSEAGRGAEFSELTVYNDRLLTFDDRTGDVFEILNNPEGMCSPDYRRIDKKRKKCAQLHRFIYR
jgi:hypothetical protein